MKQSQNVHREKSPLRLVRRHPVTSVFVLWVTLVLLAGFSTAALMNVDNSEEVKTTPESSIEPLTSVPMQLSEIEQQKQVLPWLPFGAIALSATIGCLVLSQTFRAVGYQPVQRKVSKARRSTTQQPATPQQLAKIDRPNSSASGNRSQPDSSSDATLATAVTVVPKQQNHPLDWDEPSLADSLDIRQRRPLSHWL